jgi:DNA polymerase
LEERYPDGSAGPSNGTAKVVFVGEQKGDKENLAGKPFVGPAGRVLDEALVAAGSTARPST